jgi:phage terminase small subunit
MAKPIATTKRKQRPKAKSTGTAEIGGLFETLVSTASRHRPAKAAAAIGTSPGYRDPLDDHPELLAGLSQRAKSFVREYVIDLNGSQAAIRAGYAPGESSSVQAARLLGNARVKAAIDALIRDRAARLSIQADDVLRAWQEIAMADPGELIQYRRVNCRYCWGKGFEYQRTPAEYRRHKVKWAADCRKAEAEDLPPPEFDPEGGIGYNHAADPNPECPECFGEGIGVTYYADTRKLTGSAHRLYKGVKETREGIEIMIESREKALEFLARYFKLFTPEEEKPAAQTINVEQLNVLYVERMAAAHARQREVLIERGLLNPEDE